MLLFMFKKHQKGKEIVRNLVIAGFRLLLLLFKDDHFQCKGVTDGTLMVSMTPVDQQGYLENGFWGNL